MGMNRHALIVAPNLHRKRNMVVMGLILIGLIVTRIFYAHGGLIFLGAAFLVMLQEDYRRSRLADPPATAAANTHLGPRSVGF
jgi:uncharacterized membrane protein